MSMHIGDGVNMRVVGLAVVFILAAGLVGAEAQVPAAKPTSIVTIDGAKNPDRVPDWILWREMLRVAAMLAEKSPDRGREVWVDRLHLTAGQMEQIIARGFQLRGEETAMDRQAESLIRAAGAARNDPLRSKLHEIQAGKESRILELRNLLRADIGAPAIERLQSFARLHIAPGVKVGKALQ